MNHTVPTKAQKYISDFKNCCREENLQAAQDLLDNDVEHSLDVKHVFEYACVNRKVNFVRLLMTHPQTKNSQFSRRGVEYAVNNSDWTLVEYFIFEYNLGRSGPIEELIIESPPEKQKILNDYFLKRELQKSLSLELTPKMSSSKPKI